jgi:hypothetical protein
MSPITEFLEEQRPRQSPFTIHHSLYGLGESATTSLHLVEAIGLSRWDRCDLLCIAVDARYCLAVRSCKSSNRARATGR